MIPLIEKCAKKYTNYIEDLVNNYSDHKMRALTGKYKIDIIGSCAFSIDINVY